MAAPVAFALALSSSSPSGTGSYYYDGSFKIIVADLAFHKQVSVWAQVNGLWQDIPATYVQTLPGGLELWNAQANNNESRFVAKYTVSGTTYWDNNGGADYIFPQVFDDFAALTGKQYKVVLGSASLENSNIRLHVGVQNLSYHKVVGIVFTTDNWSTVQTAYGSYLRTMKSGLEVWQVQAPAGSAGQVRFAVFYRVGSQEYWDNNFWRNYRVSASSPIVWGDAY